jgi:hypothetical protein
MTMAMTSATQDRPRLETRVQPITRRLVDILTFHADDIGVKAVYYGDQDKLAVTPCLCVESGEVTRELIGYPRKIKVTLHTHILLYHSAIRSVQTQREAGDIVIDDLTAVLHANHTLRDDDGQPMVLDSLVTDIQPGYVTKGETLLRGARLTIRLTSQELLPC